jgi:hypothetical protein
LRETKKTVKKKKVDSTNKTVIIMQVAIGHS